MLECLESKPINVYNLSQLCLDHSLNNLIKENLDCFPNQFTIATSTIVGTWCVLICIIGFPGNLLTLLAIPYAAKNKWCDSYCSIQHHKF